ncbi:MAG: hypothetical protein AB8Y83_01030 [Coxiella endosymbiont of Haemaphysalis qinghaiensis]
MEVISDKDVVYTNWWDFLTIIGLESEVESESELGLKSELKHKEEALQPPPFVFITVFSAF